MALKDDPVAEPTGRRLGTQPYLLVAALLAVTACDRQTPRSAATPPPSATLAPRPTETIARTEPTEPTAPTATTSFVVHEGEPCDASPIGTRPAPPSAPAQPALLAIIAEGDLWLWRDGEPAARRVPIGDAVEAFPSPDGTLVALTRHADYPAYPGPDALWVVGADGDGLRELAPSALLEADLGDTGDVARAYQAQWIPGTRTLTWRVSPTVVEGLGGPEPTLVRAADAETGEVKRLAFDLDGFTAMFWLPDGKHAAVVSATDARLVATDGTASAPVAHGGVMVGMGHGPFVPWSTLSRDGRQVALVVPRADPSRGGHWDLDIPFEVVTLSVPDLVLESRATFTGTMLAPGWVLSPDFRTIAVPRKRTLAGAPTAGVMHIADVGQRWTEEIAGATFYAWSPDSRHFVFERLDGHALYVGRACAEPVPVPIGVGSEPERAIVWVDAARFAFAERVDAEGDDPWNVRLATLDGTSVVLATVAGREAPRFSVPAPEVSGATP